MTEENQKNPQ